MSKLAGQLTYTLSVHIPGESSSGPLAVPAVNVGTSFGGVKDLVWKAKGWDEKSKPKKSFTFRVLNGEMYFADDDLVTSLVHVSGIFRETTDRNANPEVALYPTGDIGDKVKRESLLCSSSPVLFHGYLQKLGEGMLAGWTKRYFVLQDNTLFYFADEKTWANGTGKEKAKGFIPMPCVFVRHNNYKGQNLVFELQAKHLGKRNFFMSAESESVFEGWRRACSTLSLRRAKTVTATVCEELTTRGVSELEMIFQLPGTPSVVQQLKQGFDHGESVRLSDVSDYKAMAEVVKLALKETLQEPLFTYILYPKWLLIPQEESGRIAEVRTLLGQLPVPTQAFLEFFMGFLSKVAQSSITNMMTAKLLALCVGPVMLRSDDASKQTDDYRAIETMIEQWPAVFRTADDEKKSLKSLDDIPPPPAPTATATATAAAPANDAKGKEKDGPVTSAAAADWLKRFQLANANWEKDWRLRQKHIMNGLGELHSKLKNSGAALPSGLGDMNNGFLVEAEWRAESLSTCDELITRLGKLTALIQQQNA